jgi:hypothetical protein
MTGDWVPLESDSPTIPYHLRDDAPPLAECNRCHRETWDPDDISTEDRMPQPDGNPCGGWFVAEGSG